jgi:hypothetical protein
MKCARNSRAHDGALGITRRTADRSACEKMNSRADDFVFASDKQECLSLLFMKNVIPVP